MSRRLLFVLVPVVVVVVAVGVVVFRSRPPESPAAFWTVQLNDTSFPPSVRVAGATVAVFTPSAVEYLDKATGARLRTVLRQSGEISHAMTGTRLVVGEMADTSGTWTVTDMATGLEAFRLDRTWESGAFHRAVVTDESLAFVRCGTACDIASYDLADGTKRWSGEVCGTENSMVGGSLFMGCDGPVDLDTGKNLAWEPTRLVRQCGDALFDLGEPGVFKRLDPATGRVLWRVEWRGCGGIPGFLIDGRRVLDISSGRIHATEGDPMAAWNGTLVAVTEKNVVGSRDGSPVWTVEYARPVDLAFAGDGGVLVGDASSGLAVDPATGESEPLDGESPVGVDGGLLITVTPGGELRARPGW